MNVVQELLGPYDFEQFKSQHLFRKPFAAPATAMRFESLISWSLLETILENRHNDCWLPNNGRMPHEATLNKGTLSRRQARDGFTRGRTLLIRHAELSHPVLAKIADEFAQLFHRPVDIQLYATPEGTEGFDWHYDVEDVFVIQSYGEKEFYLKENTVTPRPLPMMTKEINQQFLLEPLGPTIQCLLKAGDWLYIPAGYWHKARAVTDSFHLSVGVMFHKAVQAA